MHPNALFFKAQPENKKEFLKFKNTINFLKVKENLEDIAQKIG